MTTLKIYTEDTCEEKEIFTDHDSIANKLHDIGVRFEYWKSVQQLDAGSSNDDIINAYRSSVDRLMEEYNFKSVDVIALNPDHPEKISLRNKFLDEHTHSDFEVRFFVHGKGLFYLHSHEKIYGVLCEKGDLISIPANTKHWFDMGENPDFQCIRLFSTPEGWIAQYTGDTIAKQFPRFETF